MQNVKMSSLTESCCSSRSIPSSSPSNWRFSTDQATNTLSTVLVARTHPYTCTTTFICIFQNSWRKKAEAVPANPDSHENNLFTAINGSICASQHPQLRTGEFYHRKILVPMHPCWQHIMHSDYGEDARVLLNGVTYTIPVTITRFIWKMAVKWRWQIDKKITEREYMQDFPQI